VNVKSAILYVTKEETSRDAGVAILLCKQDVSDNAFILYIVTEHSQILYFIISTHNHVTRLRLPHCVIPIILLLTQ